MKKCVQCSKPAVLHITELRDGEVTALHLCEPCASEYLNKPAKTGDSTDMSLDPDQWSEESPRECPNCGISFREFRAQGRLGCPHDYEVFQPELNDLLENIHGETQHVGKRPRKNTGTGQRHSVMVRLRNELRQAIEDERYEDAARLRDEITRQEVSPEDDGPESPSEVG